MLPKMMSDKYYCGLDIGEKTIKAGILKIKDLTDIEPLGVYEQKTYGFKDNAVSDLSEFSDCIRSAVDNLAQKAGVKIKEVQLGLGGAMIETRKTNTMIPLVDRGSKIITQSDIKKVNNNARLLGIKMEEEILHDLPQSYKVDDVNSAVNPVGLYGRKLGVTSLMILVNGNKVKNIMKAIHQAGYDVPHVFFTSYASSDVVLGDQERKQGCVLVDIGAQHTSVLVFLDGVLKHLETIFMGGDRFTQGIAYKIKLPFDLADEIKKSYAAASGFDHHSNEEILVKRDDAYIPIRRGRICDAIKSETEELIQAIQAVVTHSGLSAQMSCGMTVIGGGALLPGLIERLGQMAQMPVKLGQVNILLRKNLSYVATFSSVVGLARGGFKKTFRYSMAANNGSHWTAYMKNRLKELYQEYF